MATRAEVIQHIRSYSDVEEFENGMFRILYELEGGRTQNLFIFVEDHLLIMVSPFATIDEITASTAFDFATIFGIAVFNDWYVIRNVSLLADLDEGELVEMAALIASRADEFEEQIGGDDF